MLDGVKPYPENQPAHPWLGAVPASWTLTTLGAVTTRRSARNRTDLPLLSVLREKGVVPRSSLAEDENHNFIPDDLSNYRVAFQGDLVVNKMKAWQGSVGIAPCDGIVSPAYFVFELFGITQPFAHRLFRSKPYVAFFGQSSDGVRIGQWDLSIDRMKRIPVPVPPPDEQAAIVRFLGAVDRKVNRFIRAKRRLIGVLTEQKQAIITHAVSRGLPPKNPAAPLKSSGIDWLGDVPAHWEVAALRHRYDQCLGKMLDAKRITGTHLVPYLRNTDVQWDRINTDDLPQMDIEAHELHRFTVQPGDLLVCEGGDVGRCAFWTGQLEICGFQKAIHRLRALQPKSDNPRFLFYLMFLASKLGVFAASGNESTIAHLTGDKLRAHRFVFPPRVEQQAIAAYLDSAMQSFDTAVAFIKREIDLIREYRTRLVADVVTGKVDVRAAAAAIPDEPDPPHASHPADAADDPAEALGEGGTGEEAGEDGDEAPLSAAAGEEAEA